MRTQNGTGLRTPRTMQWAGKWGGRIGVLLLGVMLTLAAAMPVGATFPAGTEVITNSVGGTTNTAVLAAQDSSGNPYLAWHSDANSASDGIKVAMKSGGTWSLLASFTKATVSGTFAGVSSINDYVAIGVDGSGNVHIGFHAFIGTGSGSERGIFYAKYTVSTTTWSFEKVDTHTNASGFLDSLGPILGLSSAGVPYITSWFEDAGAQTITVRVASRATGSWVSTDIDTFARNSQPWPNLAVDSNGKVHVTWRRNTGSFIGNLMYSDNVSGTYSTPVVAFQGTTTDAANPPLDPNFGLMAIEPGGNLEIAFSSKQVYGQGGSVLVTTSSGGTSWSATTTVVTGDTFQFSINSSNNKLIVYIDNSNHVAAATQTGTGAWTSQTIDSSVTSNYMGGIINNANTMTVGYERSSGTRAVLVTQDSLGPTATAPTVTSPTATSITTNSATLGGNVTNDGGDTITARGVVLSTSTSNPTLTTPGVTNLTTSGTMGTFTVNATSLASGTTYFYSAYATNSVGTGYTTAHSSFTTQTTVSSVNRVGTTPTNAASVSWTVTFADPVSGVTSGNFSLTNTGLTGTPTIGTVTPTGSAPTTTWTVTASTGTGSGTLRLDFTDGSTTTPQIANTLQGQTFSIDHVAPTVQTINTSGTNPTNGNSVSWTVTFSKPVSGVATSNFSLTTTGLTGSPTVSTAAPSGSAPTAIWTVSASTGTGSGTIRLDMANSTNVSDSVGNAVSGLPFTGGQSFTIDRTAPTVQSIVLAGTSPTNAASVSWTVTFSEPVSGVASGNFTLVNSGLGGTPTVGTPTTADGGTTWTVPATTGSGDGTLGLNMTDATGVTDSVGNALTGLTATGAVYTIDRTAPTVQSIVHSGPSPTNAASVSWTVTFSKAVTGVGIGNFTPAVTGLGGSPAVTTVTPTGNAPTATWTVTVSTGSGSGTLGVNMTNSTNAHDPAGNAVAGLTATGDTVSVDLVTPTVQSIVLAGASPTTAASVSWTVTFTKAVSGVASGNFTLAVTSLGGTPAISTVTPTGTAPVTTWTVTASTGTKSGTLGLNMTSSSGVSDAVGNAVSGLPATGAVYTIDRTPTIATISPASGPATLTKSVTITGTKFQPSALVTFGGTAGTGITIAPDGTTITVTTPMHAPGMVDVVVTNPDTLSVTKTGGYTFVPPPSINYVSLNSGSTAGGDAYDINGASFQSGATVTFGGVAATSVVVESDKGIHVVTPPHPAGTASLDVVVTNPDGQSSTVTQQFTFGTVSGGAPSNRPASGPPPSGGPITPIPPSGPRVPPGNSGGPPQQIPPPRPNQ